jgi:formylglycine-generating enzyme required for sulfatase activity
LSAPNPLALAEMIERPARLAGLDLEPGLVDKILQDVAGESAPLALVEFTLERLYEAKRGTRLTLNDYRSFNGVGGVIEIQGERAVRNALGQVDENVLSHVFRALADVDETGGAVRKRAPLKAFGDTERVLIEQLVQSRLLETNPDEADEAWVQAAHEAVLRHWPRLTQWLESNRGFMLWRRRLKVIRESQNLLRDAALAEALGWWDKHGEDLNTDERDFIEKSLEEVEKHQQEARKRRLWGQAVLAVALVIAAGAGAWWYQDYQRRRPILKEDWVPIEPGEYCMGSRGKGDGVVSFMDYSPLGKCPAPIDPEAQDGEKPIHRVKIATPFLLAKHEVTFEEYDRFAYATNRRPPSDAGFGADFNDADRRQLPVISVSWHEAKAYAEWLSKKTGKRFRLPTEAEWEYAARAKTTARRHWGDDTSHNQACTYENVLDWKHKGDLTRFGVTWDAHACEDDYATLAPVGKFQPNKWGLHDMLGNVSEWVEDCWHGTYEGAPKDGRAWGQENGGNCKLRVVRGGSWGPAPGHVRSAARNGGGPGHRSFYLGFRLAQDVE